MRASATMVSVIAILVSWERIAPQRSVPMIAPDMASAQRTTSHASVMPAGPGMTVLLTRVLVIVLTTVTASTARAIAKLVSQAKLVPT